MSLLRQNYITGQNIITPVRGLVMNDEGGKTTDALRRGQPDYILITRLTQ
jgi:hypothetical protein